MQEKHEDKRNLIDEYKGEPVEVIARDMKARSHDFYVAIENLQHDLNIGSIVRTANAFNARGVHIIGRKHWNRRGAMATDKYIEVFHHASVEEFRDWAEKNKYEIIGVDNVDGAIDVIGYKFPGKCVLVFGQEGPGLSSEMIEISKNILMIKQYGSTRSINVAAAAAIIMHEWVRAHLIKKI